MLSFANKTEQQSAVWNCICECGKNTTALTSKLKKGFKKSCGCLKEENKLSYGESSANAVYRRYIHQAKKRNIEFNLTKDEFLCITQETCYYCGTDKSQKYTRDNGFGEFLYNGIDRLDNEIGYHEANCVACCGICNIMKQDLTEKQFYEHISRILKFKRRVYL